MPVTEGKCTALLSGRNVVALVGDKQVYDHAGGLGQGDVIMHRMCGVLVAVLVLVAGAAASAAEWEMGIGNNGLATITCQGAPVATPGYVAWGVNWNFSGTNATVGDRSERPVSVKGVMTELDITFSSPVSSPEANVLKWAYSVNVPKDMPGIIGAGIEWNMSLTDPALQGKAGEPELLPNNTGWTWAVGGGEQIEVRFDPGIANVYFERGNKAKLRCMFVPQDAPKGKIDFTMTVTLPKGGEVAKSLEERYGPVELDKWAPGLFVWDKSPVDLSYLNHKPAGKLGRVSVVGDELQFADGTPVRFWGANIQASALFRTELANIKAQAKRISQLGYNLVRIHHHDSNSWVNPNVFGDRSTTTRKLDPAQMKMLDAWIAALKEEGVYIWLDLHVGRNVFLADGVTHFDELAAKSGGNSTGIKGYCYLNDSLTRLMQEFNEQYMTHVNTFTNLAYKDDPAIMGLLLTNENDVTSHFGNGFLGDKGVPEHNKLFNADRKVFCDRTGLDYARSGLTWIPGESKIYLNDVEHRWNIKMAAQLEALKVPSLFSTTQVWGGNPVFCLPALSDSNIISSNSYNGSEELDRNARYRALSMVNTALSQVYGKPVAITEWNVAQSFGRDRYYTPIMWAALSALQGWDAPMLYGYSQTPLNESSRGRNWSSYNDPAVVGMTPAAALLYRQGHVSLAQKRYCLKLDRQNLFFDAVSIRSGGGATVRTLLEQSRISIGLPAVPELPWLKETVVDEGVIVVTDPEKDFIPAGQSYVESDTGEMRRDWSKGIQTIDAPKSQVVQGWIGGETIKLADVTVSVTTPKALVAVQAMDDEPLVSSKRILISVCARVVPEQGGRIPFHSEAVTGTVTVRASAGMELKALGPDGTATPAPITYAGGIYTINLPDPMPTHWYMLE